MTIDRRTLLTALPALAMPLTAADQAAAWPALIDPALPPIKAYERKTRGRVGLYAQNLLTGRKTTTPCSPASGGWWRRS